MSKLKEQKTLASNELNLVDLFELICPVEKKSKYIETWIRAIKNKHEKSSTGGRVDELKEVLTKELNIKIEELDKLPNYKLILIYLFFQELCHVSDIQTFQKFCEFNEIGLVKENDLTKYNTFEQISQSVGIAELKNLEKELESQTKKIYEDDEWLVIRPLTYHSSKKYGSSTKWCTTMEHNPEYFIKYARNGILIYNINKKTGLKVGTFKSLDDNEFSFWNQVDDRIDSMVSELPDFILKIIKKEVDENQVNNFSYLTKEEQTRQLNLMDYPVKVRNIPVEMPQEEIPEPITNRRRARIIEDMEENFLTEEQADSLLNQLHHEVIVNENSGISVSNTITTEETPDCAA
jgi:hypothetical protein